ncbi:MAG: decaprenyl-phosphate phosphoribosyltransferase [Caldilineaceae bacterium]|nr:decaprenyl-phosphate phosphoribosyltransferase [Caldilineaceae bacterium]
MNRSPNSTPATPAISGEPTLGSNLRGLIRTMRLKQWTKNGFVLAGLIFDGKLFDLPRAVSALVVMLAFCLISSSVYILNDLVDIEKDRLHPRKRQRPLPSGQLSPNIAKGGAALLAAVSIFAAGLVNIWAGVIVASYLILNVLYSFRLKNLVIIDVMMIAGFFVLRVVAGVVAVDVANFSPWLYVCVSLLALFLGFGKRRHEFTLLEEGAANHRASLAHYNLSLLDQILGIVTTSGLLAYTLYTFEAKTALAQDGHMLLTVPFILYAAFRYLYLIHVEKRGGAPEDLLFEDRPFLLSVLLWGLSVVLVIYLW